MTQPVKLSRERWKSLADYWSSVPLTDPSIKSVATNHLVVMLPVQSGDVMFLPAEYVPGGVDEPHGPPSPEWRRYSRGDVLNLVPPYSPCA